MGETILIEHFNRHVALTEAEREAIAQVVTSERHCRRGSVLRAEHGAPGDILLVRSGWLFSSALLEDGRRQIIRLLFKGDLLGLDGLAFTEASDATTALTDAHVLVIDRYALGALFARHARLAAVLFATQQIDRVALTDRLISLGRSSARGRVAALLLWIAERLGAAGEDIADGFALPMTQEEIGDTTGLTAVHVNRTMRVLVEQGLIQRGAGTMRILEPEKLARVANHMARVEKLDLSWLPAAQ
ncbi:Crp/Fnr family transcriptional regulator [Sphingomonas nostoxanthinifaciens]|uniref:Crp/Fnr family transcriptional regulator n=1 Tax=Sphingomonas nostoxanthinifaciens TaxID=2872652 RepID=UPI001CC21287|nr:Crp/Fnr family transcriptional regulator [Sphingomonas nostoxanthinifaciens]UAK25433.1 Crp/Fnr family transcriptional regulator [Sphingomonas nostoxanthinifaciens]